MTTKAILTELNTLGVDEIQTGTLQIYLRGTPGSVGICLAIAKIMTNFNAAQHVEDRVCLLLAMLCKRHFKKVSV